jgi:hypothetical protein
MRRRALFQGFVASCEYVVEEAGHAGEDANAALLDWFGVSVRAAEIPAHLERMRVLARKVRRARPVQAAVRSVPAAPPACPCDIIRGELEAPAARL